MIWLRRTTCKLVFAVSRRFDRFLMSEDNDGNYHHIVANWPERWSCTLMVNVFSHNASRILKLPAARARGGEHMIWSMTNNQRISAERSIRLPSNAPLTQAQVVVALSLSASEPSPPNVLPAAVLIRVLSKPVWPHRL